MIKVRTPRVLDLFAGCGGFSLGFHLAGYQIVGHVEKDPFSCKTLRMNFPKSEILEWDITKIDPNEWEDIFIQTRLSPTYRQRFFVWLVSLKAVD